MYALRLLQHRHLPIEGGAGADVTPALGVTLALVAVDRDTLHLLLGLGRLRQGHGQHTALERGIDFVCLDIVDRDAPLEPAIVALAEEPVLVLSLGPFLALDGENAIREFDADVFLLKAGQLRRDLDLLVGFAKLDVRPSERTIEQAVGAERRHVESAEDVIEHAVHFTVQRQQRICIFATVYRNVAATIPWDEISDSHGHFSLLVRFGKGQPPARLGRAREAPKSTDRIAAGPLRSGRLAVLDLLVVVAIAGVDRNPARLHGLRQLAHQLDLQEPVFKRRACHLDIVGEVELAPERTSRDALEQVVVITVLRLAAFHGQHVLLCRDGDLLRLEAGQSERDAIVILTDACDVVGRIVVLALQPERIVDEVEQAIETDGRPPAGAETEVSHSHILHLSNMDTRGAQRTAAPLDFADPRMGDRRARFRWPAFAVKRGNDDRDDSVPIAASRRPLLGITAAVRATAPALRFLRPADVVGLAVKFLQGIDHFIKLHDATGSRDLPQLRRRFDGTGVGCP